MSDENLTGKVGDGASTKDADFFEELVNNREKFDDYVYFSSMEEAIEELNRRRNDPELQKKAEEYFKDVGIPEQFQGPKGLTLFHLFV